MGRRKRIWLSFDSLDDKVFFLTVAVSIIVSIVVYITDILEGLSLSAQLAVLVILAFMLLLLFLGIRYPGRRKLLRFCLVLVLNFAMFPLSFFYSGGIHSGMILFFLVGLFLVPVMLHGKTSIAMFLLSLVFMIIIIDISQYRPHSVVPMSMEQHFQDVKVTMVISGIGLYAITVLILGAYDRERRKNNELMASLHVTISGGLVSCMDGEDLGKAMKEADKLLYQAKASGKNQICRKIETRRRTGMDIN
jgi:hypothetical protein